MGDCGSASLGFLIAFLGIQFWHSLPTASSDYLVPLLFPTVPLLAMFFAVIRRVRSGMSITEGDSYDLRRRRAGQHAASLYCYRASAVTSVLGLDLPRTGMDVHFIHYASFTSVLVVGACLALCRRGLDSSGEEGLTHAGLSPCDSSLRFTSN